MTDVLALMDEARAWGAELVPDGDSIILEAPSPLPTPLVEALRQHKTEIMRLMTAQEELDRLLGEVPSEMVVAAEAYNSARGITDPVIRKINVVSWALSSLAYRGQAEGELYQSLKTAYHTWVHLARPWEPCGFCEPQEEA